MRTIQVKLYKFDELPTDEAKEKARDWYRERVFTESSDWEFVYDDAARVAEILGIEISTSPVKLMNGSYRDKLNIWFSGFSSQGDGACFEGTYRYAKQAPKKIREYAPQDETLHRIADQLQEVQRKHFYRLYARMNHSGHYYHSGCMSVSVEDNENPYRDIGDSEETVRDLMREFADWIYDQLSNENDFQSSDEQVDEALRVNEYEFTEDGEIA